ncbi:uncharacterized protein LOC115083739 [Rhinatrema bivittatum]|uniref:uncharacterized protein LOC115083739 n=1 Tax=Rhinatrema bivittatum TaxID=194408 RepID=UPI001127C1EE|nr:uncharacterized protein LOC115083739 [Rhinatrema bivittatum]XP_029443596.1 uncharacterized protein LOC115083739 [Rhinatrema bivittatum]
MTSKKKPTDLRQFSYGTAAAELAQDGADLPSSAQAETADSGLGPSDSEGSGAASLASLLTREEARQWFIDLRADLKQHRSDLMASMAEIKEDLAAVGRRVDETETRIDGHGDAINSLIARQDISATGIEALQAKVEDLENRSRRNNLRIRGVPEDPEFADVAGTAALICKDILLQGGEGTSDHEGTHSAVQFERAHRALGPRRDQKPRDIVLSFTSFTLKERIYTLSRQMKDIQWRNLHISIYQDLAPVTLKKRFELREVTTALREKDIRYRWTFPFGLAFQVQGITHRITNITEATEAFHKAQLPITFHPLKPTDKTPARDTAPRWQRAGKGGKRLRRQPEEGHVPHVDQG